MPNYKKLLCAAVAVSFASSAFAAEEVIEVIPTLVSVENRLEDSDTRNRFGGCLAGLPPGTVTLAGCNASFVTFACDGSGGITKSAGNTAFNNANLAFVTGQAMKARVTDQVVLDGVCLAVNAQVTRTP